MSHQYGARQHKLAGSCYREGALMGCTDPPHEETKTKTKKEGGVVTYSGVFAARGPELLHPLQLPGPWGWVRQLVLQLFELGFQRIRSTPP